MLNAIDWSINRDYKSGSNNEPIEFYLDALSESTSFDLMLGYFSSAAIHVLSLGFAKFLSNGGKVRMIINDVLSEQDKGVISRVNQGYIYQIPFDLKSFPELKSRLDDYDIHFFQCLGWLIQNNRIEIKIIRPLGKVGISHYKCGIFKDGNNEVGFSGSCNFTPFGLLQNLERLDVFLSWEDGRSNKWIVSQNEEFENIFSGNAGHVEYLLISDVKTAIASEFGGSDIDELLIQEVNLIQAKITLGTNTRLKAKLERLRDRLDARQEEPRYPHGFERREYQIQAYENWIANGYLGMFAMATGTGKTVTALSCVLEEYRIHGYYQFFVLVPTIDLANQWKKDIVENFNFIDTVVCSSKNDDWEDTVREFGYSLKLGNPVNFCIVVTYASYRGKRFQNILKNLFEGRFKQMTLIADEAHTLGSQNLLKVLPTGIGHRIGLSATPERVYDQNGEAELCRFFNSFAPNHTFQYNMKEAIENNVLCKYYYYPKLVDLKDNELLKYREITKKLSKYIDPSTGKYIDSPIVNNLLIQRKNVIHKAQNKSSCLIGIVDEIGKENFRKAFIYVPEGYEANYDENDVSQIDDDDNRIIDDYTSLLYERYKFRLKKFTGDTTDRDEILKNFTDGKLDALLAMKCLDEGVDVPSTQIAIFSSSTGNPRQYIQRRGRVLRRAKGKEVAYIYDMVVKPAIDVTNTDLKQINVEKNILLGELRRLVNFAALSENRMEILKELEGLSLSYGIDIYEMNNLELQKYQ